MCSSSRHLARGDGGAPVHTCAANTSPNAFANTRTHTSPDACTNTRTHAFTHVHASNPIAPDAAPDTTANARAHHARSASSRTRANSRANAARDVDPTKRAHSVANSCANFPDSGCDTGASNDRTLSACTDHNILQSSDIAVIPFLPDADHSRAIIRTALS